MKNFNQYITEKIKLSSDRFYNPDDLNNECEILYSDVRNQEYDWWDVYDGIKYINNFFNTYLVTRFVPINKMKDIEEDLTTGSYIDKLIDEIVGRDQGYEIRLNKGHLEIDCINKGPNRATYYIYGCDDKFTEHVEDWFNGDMGNEEFETLIKTPGNIIPIEGKHLTI
jgi:hypothetical protein